MSTAPWPVGTDSGKALRVALRQYIKEWMSDEKYRERLPRQFYHYLLEGEKENPGVILRIVSQADSKTPWVYPLDGHRVSEIWHVVALTVKVDQRAGGAESVSALFGALKDLFANGIESPERAALEAAGIYMVSEAPEGFAGSPGDDSDESVASKQQLVLRCNTDTFLS